MALKDDLATEVNGIFQTNWKTRQGTVVPTDTSVTLGNDAVLIDAAVLYADLADSTKMVGGYKNWFAAEVYKAFLHCAAKVISQCGGTVTAYDGDRVMAVFIGSDKESQAVKAAMKINWCRWEIIRPAIEERYTKTSFLLNHVCGIDTSQLFVAKTGIRGANDLVWVGRAANYAAKLAALDHAKATWITAAVYEQLSDAAKFSKGVNMWQPHTWTAMNKTQIYASTYKWSV